MVPECKVSYPLDVIVITPVDGDWRHTRKTGSVNLGVFVRAWHQSHVACEENRPLVDALYELAEFTMHGDALQKGLTYQKVGTTTSHSSPLVHASHYPSCLWQKVCLCAFIGGG